MIDLANEDTFLLGVYSWPRTETHTPRSPFVRICRHLEAKGSNPCVVIIDFYFYVAFIVSVD